MKNKLCKFKPTGTSKSGKTKTWDVQTGDGFSFLGEIKWFGRWRCYAFYPDWDTIYEKQCLRRIADFCETESTKARQGWARKKK